MSLLAAGAVSAAEQGQGDKQPPDQKPGIPEVCTPCERSAVSRRRAMDEVGLDKQARRFRTVPYKVRIPVAITRERAGHVSGC